MKKLFLMLIALAVTVSLVYAETFRQGGDRLNFNPSSITTETSDYTVTSSDSMVKVTTSSADITITLPSIDDLRPGTKAYKILKTDATTYSVVVTPATGETIGGESTRYLTYQNAYMIISTSSGDPDDWEVEFESPYTVEDYGAGTTTVYGLSALNASTTQTADASLALTDCGSTQFMGTAGVDVTLPSPTQGCQITFTVSANFTTTAMTVVTSGSSNVIYGTLDVNAADVDCVDEDTISFVETAEIIGDSVTLVSDGTNWLIKDSQGSAAGGITCTQESA